MKRKEAGPRGVPGISVDAHTSTANLIQRTLNLFSGQQNDTFSSLCFRFKNNIKLMAVALKALVTTSVFFLCVVRIITC